MRTVTTAANFVGMETVPTINVTQSKMRNFRGYVNYYATNVNGTRFTNSSLDELARVIARKNGWSVKATKAAIVINRNVWGGSL